jgi:HPt (histidine-containing phosphotransfer) domain-containing protein
MVITTEVFERLRQATAKDPSVLAELCRDYLTEARKTVGQLREAIASGDAGAVRERAHYLKGSSLMIGAQEVSQSCARLERMGRESDLREAEPTLEQAIEALDAVEGELRNEFGPGVVPAEGSAA